MKSRKNANRNRRSPIFCLLSIVWPASLPLALTKCGFRVLVAVLHRFYRFS